jgi:hypothetical protein
MFIRNTFLKFGVTTIAVVVLGSAALAQSTGAAIQPATANASGVNASPRAAGLAASYGPSVGTADETGTLIDGMRTGKDVTLGDVTVSGTGKTMGFGNIDIAMALAKSQVAADATSKDFLSSLDKVMDLRSSSMGWGQIAKDLGVNLGQVMSAAKSGKSSDAMVASAAGKSGGKAQADKGQGHGTGSDKGSAGQGGGSNSNGNGNGNSGNGNGGNGNGGGGGGGGGGGKGK